MSAKPRGDYAVGEPIGFDHALLHRRSMRMGSQRLLVAMERFYAQRRKGLV